MIKTIGRLYDNLAAPVAIALTCLRPRICQNWLEGPTSSDVSENRLYLFQLARELGIIHEPEGQAIEPCLEIGSVGTDGFPYVRQWIRLMAMVADVLAHPQESQHPGTKPNEGDGQILTTPKGTERGSGKSNDGNSIAKRVSTRLRPRDIEVRRSRHAQCIKC